MRIRAIVCHVAVVSALFPATACDDQTTAPSPTTVEIDDRTPRRSEKASARETIQAGPHAHKYSSRESEGQNRSRDFWYTITIEGAKVGHRHVVRKTTKRDGTAIVETRGHEHIELVREGRTAVADYDCVARERLGGEFLEAEYRLPFGLANGWQVATVHGQSLHVRSKKQNQLTSSIPWPKDTGGPFAVEQSLHTYPLRPGASRELKLFDPSLGRVIEMSLRCIEWELTPLLEAERRLLKIESRTKLPVGGELSATMWVDAMGIVWKDSQTVGVEIVTYKTTRENALAPGDGKPLDLFRHTLVAIAKPIATPHEQAEIVYDISVANGDPSKLFVQDARQQIRELGSHHIQLIVRKEYNSKSANDPQPPNAADTQPSQLIQSNDPVVQKLAWTVAVEKTNATEVASALERLVFEFVEEKSYGKVFASASDVTKSREGDCTEHTVLLAALCRSRGIPARAAMGLVYSDAHQAFAYHMWTEVWTGDSWLGLDGTLGRGHIGPTHLKMAQSSLEGTDSMSEMASILQAVGSLNIEIASP